MRVLLTGASGFVGSHLRDELIRQGRELTCLVRNPKALPQGPLGLNVVQGDLLDPAACERAVEGQDLIYHVAGCVAARHALDYVKHNVDATRILVNATLRRAPQAKFIFVSSLAAQGPSELAKEDDPPAPISAYGASKWQAEQVLTGVKDRLQVGIIRPPMVYGPRDRQFLVLLRMMRRRISTAVSGKPRRYSVVHVSDLIRALSLMAESSWASGACYYVTEPQTYTWDELLDHMQAALGVSTLRVRVPSLGMKVVARIYDFLGAMKGTALPYNSDKYREAVAPAWVCDPMKARVDLGFEASVLFPQGMRDTVAWYRQQAWL